MEAEEGYPLDPVTSLCTTGVVGRSPKACAITMLRNDNLRLEAHSRTCEMEGK